MRRQNPSSTEIRPTADQGAGREVSTGRDDPGVYPGVDRARGRDRDRTGLSRDLGHCVGVLCTVGTERAPRRWVCGCGVSESPGRSSSPLSERCGVSPLVCGDQKGVSERYQRPHAVFAVSSVKLNIAKTQHRYTRSVPSHGSWHRVQNRKCNNAYPYGGA
jgi:hypothetical protein